MSTSNLMLKKQIIKILSRKKYNQTTKEATNNVYVSNYKEFAEQLELATKSKEKVYTINLKPGKYDATFDILTGTEDESNNIKIIINGNNQTLNGKQYLNYIAVDPGDTLELNDITFNDFSIYSAIINLYEESRVDLHNTKFINHNLEKINTELIYNYGGTLNIQDSYFINNSVSAIWSTGGIVSINNTQFINNIVTKYVNEGMIYIKGNNSYTFINNTNFINTSNTNLTAYTRNIVHAYKDAGPVKIHNSKFVNNDLAYSSSNHLIFTYTSSEIKNCSFDKNKGDICNLGNMTITNTIFTGKVESFGALDNFGNMSINNVTVTSYGGLYNDGNMTINKSNFIHNDCWDIIRNRGKLTIYDSKFLDNVVNESCIVDDFGENLILNNTILRNNKGGAIFDDIYKQNATKTTIIESTIENNPNIYGIDYYPITINISKVTSKQYGEYFNISGKIISCIDNLTYDIPLQINYNEKMYNVKTDTKGSFNLNVIANAVGTNKVSIHYE